MKQLLVLFMALALAMPTKAQWDRWNTSYAISGVLSIASQSIASAERKKAMVLLRVLGKRVSIPLSRLSFLRRLSVGFPNCSLRVVKG